MSILFAKTVFHYSLCFLPGCDWKTKELHYFNTWSTGEHSKLIGSDGCHLQRNRRNIWGGWIFAYERASFNKTLFITQLQDDRRLTPRKKRFLLRKKHSNLFCTWWWYLQFILFISICTIVLLHFSLPLLLCALFARLYFWFLFHLLYCLFIFGCR